MILLLHLVIDLTARQLGGGKGAGTRRQALTEGAGRRLSTLPMSRHLNTSTCKHVVHSTWSQERMQEQIEVRRRCKDLGTCNGSCS